MGVFDFLRQPDINQGVYEFLKQKNAKLLDVRTPGEFMDGHIPGSVNIPLQNIHEVQALLDNKEESLYVYCRSGNRSRQAVNLLQGMGYQNAKNIGGIAFYTGKTVV